jgi:hypothetical protein
MIVPAEPKPVPSPNPQPAPPQPAPVPSDPVPPRQPDTPEIPPSRQPFPEVPPAPTAVEASDPGHIRQVLAPYYSDLRDWRLEVQKLFDRTKAAQEAKVIDQATFDDIELAREGLDMEIDDFDATVSALGGKDSAVSDELGNLGDAFQSLRLAVDKIEEVLQAEAS